ncbi:MAG TPA: hypothetical protein PKB10_06015, partial [Tepidisphaeraceae bacterium]|nr:hypothetical protein [Tepidisphaeraceae bacterium]
MNKQRNDLLAGLFILVSIALGIGIIVGVKGVGRIIEPTRRITARFPVDVDLGGLRAGAEVRLGGARLGNVQSVQIESDDQGTPFVAVRFDVPERFTVRADAIVRVKESLTGGAVVNIESLGAGDPLTAGQTVAGRAGSLSEAIASISELGPEAVALTQDLRQFVGEARAELTPRAEQLFDRANNAVITFEKSADEMRLLVAEARGHLPGIIDRYNTVADRTAEAMTNLRDILGDTKDDFRTVMSNVSNATLTFRERVPQLFDRVDEVATSLQATMHSASKALEEINATAVNAKDATAGVRSIVTTNRGRIEQMIQSLKTTADNLEDASAEIRRSPWRLLYQPKEAELANLNLFDSARQFAIGARNLNDASAALRDALADPNITDEQLR